MRSLLRVATVPFLLLSACAFAQTQGNSAAGEQRRDVGAFERVHIASGLRATVTPGDTSVRLSGDEDTLNLIETVVDDGELRVRVKRGHGWRVRDVHVTISTPKLEGVEASGGATVDARATGPGRFEAEASGGSTVTVDGLDADKVEVEASGGARVTLRGRADMVEAEVSGGAVMHANALELATLDVDASGGARVEAGPSQRLSGEASGGSVVRLSRSPAHRNVKTSSGAQVRLDD